MKESLGMSGGNISKYEKIGSLHKWLKTLIFKLSPIHQFCFQCLQKLLGNAYILRHSSFFFGFSDLPSPIYHIKSSLYDGCNKCSSPPPQKLILFGPSTHVKIISRYWWMLQTALKRIIFSTAEQSSLVTGNKINECNNSKLKLFEWMTTKKCFLIFIYNIFLDTFCISFSRNFIINCLVKNELLYKMKWC